MKANRITNNETVISFRFPKRLRARLTMKAKQMGWSRNRVVVAVLEMALNQRKGIALGVGDGSELKGQRS